MQHGNRSISGARLAQLGVVSGALASLFALVATPALDAHKGITSKYTYNDDVYPILRDKCGRCHVDGGPAPMSLLKYAVVDGGAAAWGEALREMLVSETMPPYYVDPTGPAVKNMHMLSPRELDIIVTWATGGTPQGDLNKMPAVSKFVAQWSLGTPDLAIPMPEPVTLQPGTLQDTASITLPATFAEDKWVRAADLLPGTPSMVRRATIGIENGPTLAVWEPGDEAVPAPSGAAFKIPAGATLRATIFYKKPWQNEQDVMSDKSTVGLYFTDAPLSGKPITSVSLAGSADSGASESRTFSTTLASAGRVLAVRPLVDQPYTSVEIQAVTSSGRHVPILKLRSIRPEWPRRYWLADPLELPAGTKIEVKLQPGDPDSGPLMAAVKTPLDISLELVSQ